MNHGSNLPNKRWMWAFQGKQTTGLCDSILSAPQILQYKHIETDHSLPKQWVWLLSFSQNAVLFWIWVWSGIGQFFDFVYHLVIWFVKVSKNQQFSQKNKQFSVSSLISISKMRAAQCWFGHCHDYTYDAPNYEL